MHQADFAKHMEGLLKDLYHLRKEGQKEYAHDDDNAFRNFESLGIELGLPKEKILWVYLQKHLDGIIAHINGHTSQRESVHGRVKDAIVYLTLLDGMFAEDEEVIKYLDPEGDKEVEVVNQAGRPTYALAEEDKPDLPF